MTRILVPLLFGIIGCAILVGLGIWQVQRLAWKEGILLEIDAKVTGAPRPWAEVIQAATYEFEAVTVEGQFTGQELHVLTSRKPHGPGYRVIAEFHTIDGPRIMVDRGFVPESEKAAERPPVFAIITGNLRQPQEVDSITPPPDGEKNLWFARDAPAMAAALDTRNIFVVLRSTSEADPPVEPWPITSGGIPNDHLQYAITWFSLAIVWAGMTVFLLWRMRRQTR